MSLRVSRGRGQRGSGEQIGAGAAQQVGAGAWHAATGATHATGAQWTAVRPQNRPASEDAGTARATPHITANKANKLFMNSLPESDVQSSVRDFQKHG